MKKSRIIASGATPAAGMLLALLCACDSAVYVAHLAEGQLGVQTGVEPIDGVLSSDRLTEEEQAKLRLAVAAREFAVQTMGLDAGRSYTTFYDSRAQPLAFNLSAARRDKLEPYIWWFPIVGEVPYLAFFDEGYRDRIQQQMIDDGYDTHTYELDAYSTLGVFADPIRSTMLQRSDRSLVDTIIHELLHNTVWRPNHTAFNESLASFVGRAGAAEFLNVELGEEPAASGLAEEFRADLDEANAFLRSLYDDLEAFYAQPLSSQEKIAGREAVYQAARDRFVDEILPGLNHPLGFAWYAHLPTNNAWLLANQRYNFDPTSADAAEGDPTVFEAVYEAVGGDWAAALGVYRAAADSAADPFEYLRSWLDGNANAKTEQTQYSNE
jgi:predicted aminopeptidase